MIKDHRRRPCQLPNTYLPHIMKGKWSQRSLSLTNHFRQIMKKKKKINSYNTNKYKAILVNVNTTKTQLTNKQLKLSHVTIRTTISKQSSLFLPFSFTSLSSSYLLNEWKKEQSNDKRWVQPILQSSFIWPLVYIASGPC